MRRYPLFTFGLIFLSGIIADSQLSIPPFILPVLIGFLIIGFMVLVIQKKKIKRGKYALLGLLLIITIFISGVLTNEQRSSLKRIVVPPSRELLLIQFIEEIKSRDHLRTFKALIHEWDGIHWRRIGGSYLYVSQQEKITEGSDILALNNLKRIRKKSNPGEFDFSRYAALQDVYYTMSIRIDSDYILFRQPVNERIFGLEKARNNLINIIRKHFPDRREAGLAEAILLGYRKDLDQELIQDYMDTGIIHVIAISGMHLGLIFSLVSLFVTFTVGKKRSKWASFLVSLPLLWVFALLTGASASVLRSVIMFSFSITGSLIQRKNQSINGLGGSLFVLLLHDPDAWLDLGFQLSFAAVLSIMLFNKIISSWLCFRNPLLKQAWNLVAITLSAQILTTPLVLFHFHRFPTLFLFTNIIAVPLSSILLLMEVIACLLDPLPLFSIILDPAMQIILRAMNAYVGTMAKVPFGMINSIYITNMCMIGITLVIICIWRLWKHPSKTNWIWMIIVIHLISIASTIEKYKLNNTREIWICDSYKKISIIHRHGTQAMVFVPYKCLQDPVSIKRIKRITQTIGIKSIIWKQVPDQVLIFEEKEKMMIAHSSGDLWKSREWRKAAQKLHLRFHSSSDDGPLTIRCCHSTQKS